MLKLLTSGKQPGKDSVVLIDECYHGIKDGEIFSKFYKCKGCWIAGVLTGQDPLYTGLMLQNYMQVPFCKRILRRLYRGTNGITMASSTLRLASFSDYPLFLANQFSYIESFDDIKIEDINRFPGLQNRKDTLVFLMKGEISTRSITAKCQENKKSVIIEEMSLNDVGLDKDCLYITRCAGIERSSVCIVLDISIKGFKKLEPILFMLLSVYTSRAINTCVIYCAQELHQVLKGKLFPKKTVQFVRSAKDSESPAFSYQEINADLKSINKNLNPLVVAAGASTGNVHFFTNFMAEESQNFLLDVFETMMENCHHPNIEILTMLLKSIVNKNLQNECGKTPS